ncbi:protein kinase [Streptomyces sp. NBC_00569]|uniref:protein kinase n=1 Tax=unclassified Streptomyces TaxID=2593676 RepID=UPI0022515373|nr:MULTISPECIES: protein kinase [unclassified Streptomyces]MCX5439107.1 protein kinase [Streptomyces sp. NBC_00063]WUB94398.1 protein kinase [Streptomyces sp. NBC_00569]
MEDYAGRVLADRYRLPLSPADAYEFAQTRAFDTYSGQEVLIRQVPLPEVVEAEVLDAEGLPDGFVPRESRGRRERGDAARTTRRPADPAVRRAIEAAQAAAQIPDHPRLDQVFDVFAEGGSLWIVSEVVSARPLAALLAEEPLSPYRAAEVASDVLTALRALHAHGWVHRNITARTVLVCDDGRIVLTGLAAGAAEEALCGYDPTPAPPAAPAPQEPQPSAPAPPYAPPAAFAPAPSRPAALEAGSDPRAARAGAIAAYRAGARAAARGGLDTDGTPGPPQRGPGAEHGGESGTGAKDGGAHSGGAEPGRIDDPYGVRGSAGRPWHGAIPRPGMEQPEPSAPAPETPAPAPGAPGATRWDQLIPAQQQAAPAAGRGPTTALAADRARQARMTVVGPVTERWAPEQAGPVHENWQLAAPIGPATDLWALGALLFRAVQGHAPYPEENTGELVQMVCAEPPAFAEECGPLRPVVESLLRQDPTERLDFEELRGWLRSLVRSAPEPEAGTNVVAAPPFDATRLPVVRRRGELVRRRRRRSAAQAGAGHARHKRAKAHPQQAERHMQAERRTRPERGSPERRTPSDGQSRKPRSLGRTLLVLVLLGLAAAVAYAVVFMPKAEPSDGTPGEGAKDHAGATGGGRPAPEGGRSTPAPSAGESTGGQGKNGGKSSSTPAATDPQTDSSEPEVAQGFTLRKDPEGFRVAVAKGWNRQGRNGQGQVLYTHGDFELVVVPGRDSTSAYGSDPMTYQREKERELQPFRDSTWATSSGMRRIDVGGRAMAEGQFTWQNSAGRETYVRNLAMIVGGRYHVVQLRGPEAERDEVTRLYEQASATYRSTG